MKSTKDSYKSNEDVVCTKCGKTIKAKDMCRYREYIYCDDCVYKAAHMYYSHKDNYNEMVDNEKTNCKAIS